MHVVNTPVLGTSLQTWCTPIEIQRRKCIRETWVGSTAAAACGRRCGAMVRGGGAGEGAGGGVGTAGSGGGGGRGGGGDKSGTFASGTAAALATGVGRTGVGGALVRQTRGDRAALLLQPLDVIKTAQQGTVRRRGEGGVRCAGARRAVRGESHHWAP